MANINCSLDCIHEKNGKCLLKEAVPASAIPNGKCAYYKQKKKIKSHLQTND
ncbi:MAG TPA: hydroxymyristoyl-ACP dehydratase [Clostridiales bacterium]|nr:hydroxymyristoyl-ACP dehydratase [Clostridiales bacterium]